MMHARMAFGKCYRFYRLIYMKYVAIIDNEPAARRQDRAFVIPYHYFGHGIMGAAAAPMLIGLRMAYTMICHISAFRRLPSMSIRNGQQAVMGRLVTAFGATAC